VAARHRLAFTRYDLVYIATKGVWGGILYCATAWAMGRGTNTCPPSRSSGHSACAGQGNAHLPLHDIVSLLIVCARINLPFILAARLHCLQCCSTIARLLGNIYITPHPPPPPLCMPYTIQYWSWQYLVKAKTHTGGARVNGVGE